MLHIPWSDPSALRVEDLDLARRLHRLKLILLQAAKVPDTLDNAVLEKYVSLDDLRAISLASPDLSVTHKH